MKIETNKSLLELNTFGVPCTASSFVSISNLEQLRSALQYSNAQQKNLLILGGGSNVLLPSQFDGLVLSNDLKGIRKFHEDREHVWVECMGGENWDDLVRFSVSNKWGGLENLSLIPGSVGAAPMQNIGAYGIELCDSFDYLLAMEIKTGALRVFDKQDCEFGYRESVFKRALKGQYVIVSIVVRLAKKPKLVLSYGAIKAKLAEKKLQPSVAAVREVVVEIRRAKLPDPASIGNCGSFFKNVLVSTKVLERIKKDYPEVPSYPQDDPTKVKIPTGWLVEKCGWKGKRVGNTGAYEKQALVLVNHGGATGEEVLELSEKIIASVKQKFDIAIEREVNVIL